AAPLEFSDSVGMPFKEGLAFVHNCLVGFGLRQQIRVFASGKITTGFHIFKTIALGANACYSARAMMMALGCIQALECNKNTCPTGVATQDPELVKGLVVADKTMRIANYHAETLKSFVELMAAAGIDHPSKINRSHIFRRINQYEVRRYDEIFPYIPADCLLNANTVPQEWQHYWQVADANKF
nr:glutamate synthase-related protein [Chitinophagales bacterium]